MNVSVLGCGRWGSFIAWYQATVLKNRVISWSAVDNADSYTVYRKTSDATLIVAKGITETSYTVDEGQPGEYWVVAATSDGLYSARSNTVTV